MWSTAKKSCECMVLRSLKSSGSRIKTINLGLRYSMQFLFRLYRLVGERSCFASIFKDWHIRCKASRNLPCRLRIRSKRPICIACPCPCICQRISRDFVRDRLKSLSNGRLIVRQVDHPCTLCRLFHPLPIDISLYLQYHTFRMSFVMSLNSVCSLLFPSQLLLTSTLGHHVPIVVNEEHFVCTWLVAFQISGDRLTE
jgi:hypothetical protein